MPARQPEVPEMGRHRQHLPVSGSVRCRCKWQVEEQTPQAEAGRAGGELEAVRGSCRRGALCHGAQGGVEAEEETPGRAGRDGEPVVEAFIQEQDAGGRKGLKAAARLW